MKTQEQYDYLDSDTCGTGTYLITTVNGSSYLIEVPLDGAMTMRRQRHAAPTDPELGVETPELYGDGDAISLFGWMAFRDPRGAVFYFYAEDARQCENVEDYAGSVRHTSAVVAIERLSPPA